MQFSSRTVRTTSATRPAPRPAPALAAFAALLATVASGAGVTWLTTPALRSLGRPAPPLPDQLSAMAAVALLATWCWGVACAATCLVDVVRRRPPATVGAPLARLLRPAPARLLTRRLLAAGLVGGSTATGAFLPVMAMPAHHTATIRHVTDALEGLTLPGRPLTARPPSSTTHVVLPGDTLWAIAGRRLAARHEAGGPAVSAAAIDRAWRELYRLNIAQIGPDPDLLRPGVRLTLPSDATRHEEASR